MKLGGEVDEVENGKGCGYGYLPQLMSVKRKVGYSSLL